MNRSVTKTADRRKLRDSVARGVTTVLTVAFAVAVAASSPTGVANTPPATVETRGPAPDAAAPGPTREARRFSFRWLDRLGAEGERQIDCLALNVYHEARSEPVEGQLAVAAVTLNRVLDPRFPDTICEVVRDGGEAELHRCQFSWWCDGRDDEPADARAWSASLVVARTALFFDLPDPTAGALWYHATYVKPSWSKRMRRIARIGEHIFYGEKPSRGRPVQLARNDADPSTR